jgi:hypothetical protein
MIKFSETNNSACKIKISILSFIVIVIQLRRHMFSPLTPLDWKRNFAAENEKEICQGLLKIFFINKESRAGEKFMPVKKS